MSQLKSLNELKSEQGRSKFDDLREQMGMDPPTTKENAAVLYNGIKNGKIDITSLSKETQSTLKKFLDDNGGNLELPKGIDWTQYGIDVNASAKKKEEEKQIADQDKKLVEQKQLSLTQQKNSYQTTYHLDNSALIGIGMICVTVLIIIIMVLIKRKTNNS